MAESVQRRMGELAGHVDELGMSVLDDQVRFLFGQLSLTTGLSSGVPRRRAWYLRSSGHSQLTPSWHKNT